MSDHYKERQQECPFVWGDRIDHKFCGFGTIVSEPKVSVGQVKDRTAPGGYALAQKGWTVTVRWDDSSRGTFDVASEAISLVERPDAKGGAFWRNEFEKFLKPAIAARNVTSTSMTAAYRPKSEDGVSSIKASLEKEKQAIEALLHFLAEDEAGNHP
ncbi:hypothetical protein [Rhodobacter sp. NSM]|uniref:hypothetical protein n=1 Tax=Rhodobacter sp. NSM TaxID=3457501 RepID=UPI003FD26B0B